MTTEFHKGWHHVPGWLQVTFVTLLLATIAAIVVPLLAS